MTQNTALIDSTDACIIGTDRKTTPTRKAVMMNATWNEKRRREQAKSKGTIAYFLVDQFMKRHGIFLQFGNGSLHGFVADILLEFQTRPGGESLDHTIFTNDEELYKRFEEAQDENPVLFANMQLVSSGGRRHRGLKAWQGQLAARNVGTDEFKPTITLVTAFGILFGNRDVTLSYKFDVELPTQVALATRRTSHRIVAGDYTKIGENAEYCADVDLRRLTMDTERLTFVVTRPSKKTASFDPRRFASQIDTLVGTFSYIAHREDDPDRGDEVDEYYGKEIDLYILEEGHPDSFEHFSLNDRRAEIKVSKKAPGKIDWQTLQPSKTDWYDSDSSNLPFRFAEVEKMVAQGESPFAYHLAASQCSQYTTFAEFVKGNIYCQSTQKV